MVNLRKRTVKINYNVDEYYEKMFEDCDQDVKECVLESHVKESDNTVYKETEATVVRKIKEGLGRLEKINTISGVNVNPDDHLCVYARVRERRIKEILGIIDNAMLLIKLRAQNNVKTEDLKNVVIDRLKVFMKENPENDWSKYLKELGVCKCGEEVSIVLEDECARCFVERE